MFSAVEPQVEIPGCRPAYDAGAASPIAGLVRHYLKISPAQFFNLTSLWRKRFVNAITSSRF